MIELSKELKEVSALTSFIYRDEKLGIEIGSIPNWTYGKIICFYVKIFKNYKTIDNDYKFTRLSMLKPEYIFTENGNSILSKEEINKVINILKSRDHGDINILWSNKLSNWDALIFEQNNEHEYDEEFGWVDLPKDLPIPDYTLLPTRD